MRSKTPPLAVAQNKLESAAKLQREAMQIIQDEQGRRKRKKPRGYFIAVDPAAPGGDHSVEVRTKGGRVV